MKNKVVFVIILFFIYTFGTEAQAKKLEAAKDASFITYKLTHPLHEFESTSKDSYCSIVVDLTTKEIKDVFVQVDVTTFDSGNSNRDSHAMEVVDALTYPTATFKSTSLSSNGDKTNVSGKLTFHGVTKDIVIPVSFKWSKDQLVVDGSFDISLTEFNIERPKLLMIPVKDDLQFTLRQTFNLD